MSENLSYTGKYNPFSLIQNGGKRRKSRKSRKSRQSKKKSRKTRKN